MKMQLSFHPATRFWKCLSAFPITEQQVSSSIPGQRRGCTRSSRPNVLDHQSEQSEANTVYRR